MTAPAPTTAPRRSIASSGPRLLAAAALLWLIAAFRAGFALRETTRIRSANAARIERLHALDPAFQAFLTRELAAGCLLNQARTADPVDVASATDESASSGSKARAATACLPGASIVEHTLAADLSGHPIREITAIWESVSADDLATALRDAENATPPLRLRRAEIAARPDGALSVTAVFETL